MGTLAYLEWPNVYIARAAGDEADGGSAGKKDGEGSGVPVGAESPQSSVLIISSGQGCKIIKGPCILNSLLGQSTTEVFTSTPLTDTADTRSSTNALFPSVVFFQHSIRKLNIMLTINENV